MIQSARCYYASGCNAEFHHKVVSANMELVIPLQTDEGLKKLHLTYTVNYIRSVEHCMERKIALGSLASIQTPASVINIAETITQQVNFTTPQLKEWRRKLIKS